MQTTHAIFIVPGWRNSAVGSWQSLCAAQLPDAVWVAQDDWVTPARTAWVHVLSRAVQAQPHPVVVAHSLGCIATTHLPADGAARFDAALLVAAADPDRRAILSDFALVPGQRLPYRHASLGRDNHFH